MKFIQPVKEMDTDILLYLVKTMNSLSFPVGVIGGIGVSILLSMQTIEEQTKTIYAAITIIGLLMFYFMSNRYIEKHLIPEIKKRCTVNEL